MRDIDGEKDRYRESLCGERVSERETEKDRYIERERDRETERETERQRERERETERQRGRDREKQGVCRDTMMAELIQHFNTLKANPPHGLSKYRLSIFHRR